VVLVEGKNSKIASSQLYEYNISLGDNPWALIENISAAVDSSRIELAINPASMGIGYGNFTIYTAMKDWGGDEDVLDEAIDSASIPEFAPLSTRGSSGDQTLAPKPRISVTKTANVSTVGPGDVIMYTITYTNNRNPAYNVVLTETYPAGVTFLDANPAPTAGDNVWDIGTLANGESGTIFINVTVDATVVNGDILTNTMAADWTDGASWSGNTDDSIDTTVVIVPEFGLGPLSGMFIIMGVFLIGRKLKISK